MGNHGVTWLSMRNDLKWKGYLRAVVVNCNEIDAENRCATAMHTSIPGPTLEPLHLLIPIHMIDPLSIESISIVLNTGDTLSISVDPASARDALPRRRDGQTP
jgi:hypothetical protein